MNLIQQLTGATPLQLLGLFVLVVLGFWVLISAAEAADDQRKRQDKDEE